VVRVLSRNDEEVGVHAMLVYQAFFSIVVAVIF